MTAKTNKRKRKLRRHIVSRRRDIVPTPVRAAIECCIEVRREASRHWSVGSVSRTVVRLSNGRAPIDIVRAWANGRRRAPAWFIAVLREQVLQRRAKLDAVLADLDRYQPLDRARRSREQSIRARRIIAEGKGAIGQRIRRKALEALEREQRLRAIYPPQGENNEPVNAGLANTAEKTTPTIDR
jgi:hypothetical protein